MAYSINLLHMLGRGCIHPRGRGIPFDLFINRYSIFSVKQQGQDVISPLKVIDD